MKPRHKISDVLFQFVIAILFLGAGAFMLIRKLIVVGLRGRDNQPTGFGGEYLIFAGVIFLVVAYFSLSPFSPIREFLEGKRQKNKSNKKSIDE